MGEAKNVVLYSVQPINHEQITYLYNLVRLTPTTSGGGGEAQNIQGAVAPFCPP